MLLWSAVLALCLASGAMAGSIPFEDCGIGKTNISTVYIDGCYETPCEISHGDTVTGGVVFTSNTYTETLTCDLYGIIFGEEVPFPGGCLDTNGCHDVVDGNCPIEIGEEIEYVISMLILDSYPTLPVTGKWTLLDDLDEMYLCFLVDVVILP